MAKTGVKRLVAAEEMLDMARGIILRGMADLRINVQDDVQLQAKEYARAASKKAYFKGSSPSRQTLTSKTLMTARFKQRLEWCLEIAREIDSATDGLTIVHVQNDHGPIHVDAKDIEMMEEGLRIVVEAPRLFDRLSIQELTPPPAESSRNVIVDVLQRQDDILVMCTAIANAVYGQAGLRFNKEGHPLEIGKAPDGEDFPLDDEICRDIWTMAGLGARTIAKMRPKAKKPKLVEVREEAQEVQEPSDKGLGTDIHDMMAPVAEAPFDQDEYDAYATLMDRNTVTRTIVEVFSDCLVKGRLDDQEGDDILEKSYHKVAVQKARDSLLKTKRKYRMVLSDPEMIGQYEEYASVVEDNAKSWAKEKSHDYYGQRFAVMIRMLAMHARSGAFVTSLEKCEGKGDQTIKSDREIIGMVLVKNRSFYEIAREEQEYNGYSLKVRREVPVAILYHIDIHGAYGIVYQLDAKRTNMILDFQIHAEAMPEEEGDLEWAIRNILAEVAEKDHPRIGEPSGCECSTAKDIVSDLAPAVEMMKGRPSGRRMRRHAQISLKVQDYSAASNVVDEWFDTMAAEHDDALILDQRSNAEGWRIEHANADGTHVWAITVQNGPQTPPNVEVLVETTQERADPSLPGLIREMARRTEVHDLDGKIETKAICVVTKPQMRSLMDELTRSTRRMPILVLTSDENGRYLVDPDQTALRTAGYLKVYTVVRSLTIEMKDSWGQPYSVFNGAARIYQPGFDPKTSNPLAHQRFMPGHNAHHTLNNAITREADATLSRYQIHNRLENELTEAARSVTEDLPVEGEEEVKGKDFIPPPVRFTPVKPARRATAKTNAPPEESGQEEKEEVATGGPDPDDEPELPLAEIKDLTKTDSDLESAPEARQESIDEKSTSDEIEDFPLNDRAGIGILVRQMVVDAMDDYEARLAAVEKHIQVVNQERDNAVRQVEAVRDKALDSARREREEGDRHLNDYAELIRIAEQEREDALAELAEAKEDLDEALLRNRMLEAQIARMRERSGNDEPRPSMLADVGEWANNQFAGRLVILPRACKALRKSNYTDVERTVRMIELLAGPYIDARSGVDGAHDRWLEGIESIRVKDFKQPDAGGSEDQQYHVRYQGRGMRLDRHLKGNESCNRDRGVFRVYYTYDELTGQVVVGWLPDHLTTAAT